MEKMPPQFVRSTRPNGGSNPPGDLDGARGAEYLHLKTANPSSTIGDPQGKPPSDLSSASSFSSTNGVDFDMIARNLLPVREGPLTKVGVFEAGPSTAATRFLPLFGPESPPISEGSSISEADYESQGSSRTSHELTGKGSESVDRRGLVESLWARIRTGRSRAHDLKRRLQKERARANELRKLQSDAFNAFMGAIRPQLTAGKRVSFEATRILVLFDRMQAIQNTYSDQENKVAQLESKLDNETNLLSILETQFYEALRGKPQRESREPSPAESGRALRPMSSRTSLAGIPVDRPDDIHPLYTQLLDAAGHRELVREQYLELASYRDALLYEMDLSLRRKLTQAAEGLPDAADVVATGSGELEQIPKLAENLEDLDAVLSRYSLTLDQDDYEFLKSFPAEILQLQEQLKRADQQVDQLRQHCRDAGVMRRNLPYNEEFLIFSGLGKPFSAEVDTMSIVDDEDEDDDDAARLTERSLEHERFPILLSNPRHILEDEPLTALEWLKRATRLPKDAPERPQLVADAMKEYGISRLVLDSGGDKTEYINRWLLHRLRTSPLEAELLYSVYSRTLRIRNTRRWQEDVLYSWPRDTASVPSKVPSTPSEGLVMEDDDASPPS